MPDTGGVLFTGTFDGLKAIPTNLATRGNNLRSHCSTEPYELGELGFDLSVDCLTCGGTLTSNDVQANAQAVYQFLNIATVHELLTTVQTGSDIPATDFRFWYSMNPRHSPPCFVRSTSMGSPYFSLRATERRAQRSPRCAQ
jgi:hypothetical protein